MKKKFRFSHLLMIGIMLVTFLVLGETKVLAETEASVRVEVYKLSLEADNPAINGQDVESLLKNYPGLNGVTYSAFDVTKDYYAARDEGLSKEEAQEKLALLNVEHKKVLASATTTTMGEQKGVAVFDLPVLDANNHYRVYLFKETGGLSTGTIGTNLVLVLPISGEDKAIRLFPKQQHMRETPPFEKEADRLTADYGEYINYHLETKIPSSIWTYNHFEIEDRSTSELILAEASIEIVANGNELDKKVYGLTTTDHGFKIVFDPLALQPYASQNLSIRYQMKIKPGTAVETALNNKATLTVNEEKIVKEARVKTGGARFRKVDHLNFKEGLADAIFIVGNEKQEYLTQTGWQKFSDEQLQNVEGLELQTYTSDKGGNFEVLGLAYGEYHLREVVAPKGYVLSDSATSFTVGEKSYLYQTKAAPTLNVVNVKETNPKKPPRTDNGKKTLPKTGEQVGHTYLIIGLVFLVSYVLVKKHSVKPLKENE